MIDGYSSAALVFLAASALTAGLARGLSGFGGALIFVPLASAVVGPRWAAPLLLMIDSVSAAGLVPNAWRRAARREVATMAAGALFGVPLGVWLLAKADPLALRWGLAATITGALVLLISGWRYRGRRTRSVAAGVGLLGGVLSGTAQIGGPPIATYWLSGALSPEVVRASLILYFAISTVFSAIAYVAGGLITRSVLMLALLIGPVYALGMFLGARLFGVASETAFRWVCYALIGIATIVSLPLLDTVMGR